MSKDERRKENLFSLAKQIRIKIYALRDYTRKNLEKDEHIYITSLTRRVIGFVIEVERELSNLNELEETLYIKLEHELISSLRYLSKIKI